MKIIHGVLAAILAIAPLAACGDSGGGEAKQEGKVEQARLQEFVAFLPSAPKGFSATPPQFVTGDTRSQVGQIYQTPGGDAFSIEIVFSSTEVAKYQAMIDENSARSKARASLKTMGSWTALTFDAPAANQPQYVMIVSPSRFVSVTPIYGDTIKPIMSYVFEQVDFAAIGEK